jgi:uncharacterized protein DUF6897
MPIFIILFIVIPQQREVQRFVIIKSSKKKRGIVMTNEIVNKYIGKNCKISTGSYGTTVVGKIVNVIENWIEVETKKGIELVNAEFIQSIKIKQWFQ